MALGNNFSQEFSRQILANYERVTALTVERLEKQEELQQKLEELEPNINFEEKAEILDTNINSKDNKSIPLVIKIFLIKQIQMLISNLIY